MNDLKERAVYLLSRDCDDAIIFLIASSYLWAIMLFLPGNTFDKQTYFLMSVIATEWQWGLIFLLYSIVGTWILIFKSKRKYLLQIEAIFGFFLWSITAACVFFSTSQAPAAAAPHIVGAFLSWWILIRTGIKNV